MFFNKNGEIIAEVDYVLEEDKIIEKILHLNME